MSEVPLNIGATVTLVDDGTGLGTGSITIGPDSGPPYWHIDDVVMMTDRPGASPVPRAVVYLDTMDANGLQGATYDGSLNSASANIDLSRGQHLIVVWTGGAIGDVATLSLTGTRRTQ